MSILVSKDTRLAVQGITGREGEFHTRQMLEYGTNIVAGVTTRHGGLADLPATPQLLKQVHGNRVVRLGDPDFAAGSTEADAVIGDRAGAICVVQTADCLPVLFCASDSREIAAAHAGWRGLAGGVLDATIARLSTPPAELLAWLGPAIGQARFEVGGEVREAFAAAGFDCASRFTRNPDGRWQADLFGLAEDRLHALGVAAVYGRRDCTFDQPDRYYSYRRDGTTGRMLSFVHRR